MISSYVALHAHAAEPVQLNGGEAERYLSALMSRYGLPGERDALLAHGNGLLNRYALRVAYQIGVANPQDLSYRLSVGESGELRVREEVRGPGNGIAVRNRSLSVFGLDPYLSYRCQPQGLVCIIDSPADGTPLVTIRRDPEGAEELAKVLSFLIRNLQKG
ncbi:hypothetical protein YO5_16950 [Stutzerimonas stutzeri TS44]|nr:hypothetical protein YO5_16950 [Stutzerimonas stutzeri TS44]